MEKERKNIFSRSDIWAILFLLACIILGGAMIMYQKTNRQLPPELLIETVKLSTKDNSSTNSTSPEKINIRNLCVNINSASADSLELIPGIGPVYASKIVENRNANGRFQSIEDITRVKGIGSKTFEEIEKYLTVE
jgi:comEA protein